MSRRYWGNKLKLNEVTLTEAKKGNINSSLFKSTGKEVNDLQKKIDQKVKELQSLVQKRSLAGTQLDLLRSQVDSDSEGFDLLTLKKLVAKAAKSGPFSKTFPKQVADDLMSAIKKG